MNKTVFKISKMDCPSEENLIRMQLDNFNDIFDLDFKIPERVLIVYHKSEITEIEKSIHDLNLNATKIKTENIENLKSSKNEDQRRSLFLVLIINFIFFIIEIITGIFSKSMGLIADSLDMLADSFVYILSLYAIGKTLIFKKQIVKISGWFQIVLATYGFIEVIRRFIYTENIPEFSTMIVVSIFALIANGICLYILHKSKSKEELHFKASMIFTSNDIIINMGVITAGFLVSWFNSNKPDLFIGAIVLLLVMQGAIRILKLYK